LEQFDLALACWQQAAEIFRAIEDPKAAEVEGWIAQLREQLGGEAFAELEAEVGARREKLLKEAERR